jgi:hypothetical protein
MFIADNMKFGFSEFHLVGMHIRHAIFINNFNCFKCFLSPPMSAFKGYTYVQHNIKFGFSKVDLVPLKHGKFHFYTQPQLQTF